MHGNPLNYKNLAVRFALAAGLVLAMLLAVVLPAAAATSQTVKFQLKADPSDPAIVDVVVSFTLSQDQIAVLQPPSGAGTPPYGPPTPAVEVHGSQNPQYSVQPLEAPGAGWTVTANTGSEVTVPYTVRFPDINSSRSDVEAPGGAVPPRAIFDRDLKVVRASDVLMCPRKAPGGPLLSSNFRVDVSLASGQKALAPWQANGTGGSSFTVTGESRLLDNYVGWGTLDLVKVTASKTVITLGYSSDYSGLTGSEKRSYTGSLTLLFDRLNKTLGQRGGLERLAVVLCGQRRFGLKTPASGTMLDSVVLCGGKTLEGDSAASAANGFFELWNRFSLVPKQGGDAAWFQAGLPLFYPLRVAASTGLMDFDTAYSEFSQVYRKYLTDPATMKVSLVAAAGKPGKRALLARKGAALSASISRKLTNESKGAVKDIDWLLGQMALKNDHFKGRDYSLVDISELVEGGTGTSWDRYFDGRVRGTQAVLSSEFSATDLFGSTSSLGRPLVVGKGSGRSWIYLVVAIAIILMVPIVFSTYVRRAVNLDMTMPKILPDDDD